MYSRTLLTITVALVLGTPLRALAESFDVKPGTWQMSLTTLIAGKPIPQEALESMPADKRAMVEEALKKRAGKPLTISQKTCVSQKDLDQDRILHAVKEDKNCARNILSRSATKLVMEQTCPEPYASTAQMTIEAATPETLTATIDLVRAEAKGKIHLDVKGHWLAESCEGAKDDD
jgi:hypothetical protein